MLKNTPNVDIFDRLYKKTAQDNLPPQVIDNIHFLNKHCKFLSFAEKEHIVKYLKRREPQIEAMISDFKANKITKEFLKDLFYTILYPKRFTKRFNENSNPNHPEVRTHRAKVPGEHREQREKRSPTPVPPLKPDLAIYTKFSDVPNEKEQLELEVKGLTKRMEYLNSLATPQSTPRQQTLKSPRGTQSSARTKAKSVIKALDMNEDTQLEEADLLEITKVNSQKLTEIDQFLQKIQSKADSYSVPTSFTEEAEPQDSHTNVAVRIETFQDQMGDDQMDQVEEHQYMDEHNERTSQESGRSKSVQNPMDDMETVQSEEFSLRRQRKTRMINEEDYRRGRIPSSSPAKHNNADTANLFARHTVIKPDLSNPFALGVRFGEDDEYSTGLDSNRGFGTPSLGAKRGSIATIVSDTGNKESARERSERKVETSVDNPVDARITAEFINKDHHHNHYNHHKKPSDEKSLTITHNGASTGLSSDENPIIQPDSKNSGNLQGISAKPDTVCISDPDAYYKALPNLGKRIEECERTFVTSPHFTSPEKNMLDYLPETQSQNIQTLTDIPMTMLTAPSSKSVLVTTDTHSQTTESNVRPESSDNSSQTDYKAKNNNQERSGYFSSASGDNAVESRYGARSLSPMTRDAKTDLENSHYYGAKTERFVSVNLIKRVFEENSIYAEDIVDEIFRNLGEYIVNKNFFTQILTNYLNCLPPMQNGIQPKDISSKVFEICDRNGDGLISINDLGSRATLFSQLRPGKTKEKAVYGILDPQNRGFILETDIINALTKAQALAKSNGDNLFEDYEEILKEAQRISKQLDKERKGIVTYWDIFIWRNTTSFAELSQKLQKYTSKLDTFTSAKKSRLVTNKNLSYTAQKLYDENDIASPSGFKPFSSAIQGFAGGNLLESKLQSNNNNNELLGKLTTSDLKIKEEDFKEYSLRKTANFTSNVYGDMSDIKVSLGDFGKGEENLESIDEKDDIGVGMESSSIKETTAHEFYFGARNVKNNNEFQNNKVNSFKEQTRADSDTEPTNNSVELPVKKNLIDAMANCKRRYGFQDDFEFRESECLERNGTANSFI